LKPLQLSPSPAVAVGEEDEHLPELEEPHHAMALIGVEVHTCPKGQDEGCR